MAWYDPVLYGVASTLLITVCAFAIGATLALPLMLALRSPHVGVRVVARAFIDLVRGVPVAVWLFVLYFGVSIGDFRFEPLGAAIVGLGLVCAAYLAEVYRGAMLAVPTGQFEAAHALGLGRADAFVRVVGPQALRVALPSTTTFAIALLKDSSIASTIGVTEIVFRTQAQTRVSDTGLALYLVAALAYVALCLPLGLLSRVLDRRLRQAVVR